MNDVSLDRLDGLDREVVWDGRKPNPHQEIPRYSCSPGFFIAGELLSIHPNRNRLTSDSHDFQRQSCTPYSKVGRCDATTPFSWPSVYRILALSRTWRATVDGAGKTPPNNAPQCPTSVSSLRLRSTSSSGVEGKTPRWGTGARCSVGSSRHRQRLLATCVRARGCGKLKAMKKVLWHRNDQPSNMGCTIAAGSRESPR